MKYHIPEFLKASAKIAAVCDKDLGSAARASALAGNIAREISETPAIEANPAIFTDHREILARKDVEAVSICVHNAAHMDVAVAAAKAQKAVFLEKPMARSADEAKKILEAVNASGVVFQLGVLNRFRPEAAIVNARRESGAMGEICHSDAKWLRRRGAPSGWFNSKRESGGGPGVDIGVHMIDLAWYLMGKPKPISVSGMAHSGIQASSMKSANAWEAARCAGACDVEDSVVAFIRFENGKTMFVSVSWTMNGPEEDFSLKLYGAKEGASLPPLVLHGEQEGFISDTFVSASSGDAWKDAFSAQAAHFVSCVSSRKKTICPAEEGWIVQRILDAVYESSEAGREVLL
jgi:predicted dehydrogenase